MKLRLIRPGVELVGVELKMWLALFASDDLILAENVGIEWEDESEKLLGMKLILLL